MNWNIFATVISWLVNIAKGLRFWGKALLDHFILTFTKGWAVLLIFVGLIWIAIQDMGLMIGSLLSLITTVDPANPGSLAIPTGMSYWLSVANTFFPMDEAFGYLIILAHLWAGFGLYKLIKSWIPTVSGGG